MNRRPGTLAETFEAIADWLDVADRAIAVFARQQGVDPEPAGNEVQIDLRVLAAHLAERPDLDAELRSFLG